MEPTAIIDGKYQVVRQLGEGGMGAVYEATHRGTGRRVAIKVIAGSDLAKNPEVVIRFQREARASGAIETQHITQVLDTGTDPASGNPYMVMEFLAGEDVLQAVRRLGPLPPDLVLRIAAQACVGLNKAHQAHIIHRDIKSANLFLTRREQGEIVVKLLDFGVAKVKNELTTDPASLTRTGSMIGSPLYMSPEQATGSKSVDHRSDLWSLGVVMYEALTGLVPHAAQDSLGGLIYAICSEPPQPVQDRAPWVPPEVAAIVHKALALTPAGRYGSAEEMLHAVRALLPGGSRIDGSMIRPLSAEARAQAAPRFVISAPGTPPPGPSFAPGTAALVAGDSVGASVGTVEASGSSGRGAQSRRQNALLLPVAIAGVLAVFGGALAAFRMTGPPPAPTATVRAAAPPPAPTPAPAPAEPPPPATRTVLVSVTPANVKVEVDGEEASVDAAAPDHGTVQIEGTLGSTHSIVLKLGKVQKEAAIVIADTGAVPAKVSLFASAGGRPGAGRPKKP